MKLLELNYAQRRVLWQRAPNQVYVVTVSIDIDGLSEGTVRAAIAELAYTHEALRSRLFFGQDGRPVHEVAETVEEAEGRIEIIVHEIHEVTEIPEISVTAPVSVDPTMHAARCDLYTIDGAVRHMTLTVTHLFADGMSQGVLYSDLAALLRGEPIVGRFERRQVSDYADPLLAGVTRENTGFWREHLAYAPRSCTFSGYVRGGEETLQSSRRADGSAWHLIMEASRQFKASPFTIWAAALSALVSRYTGQDRHVFRSLAANRFEAIDNLAVANLAQPVYVLVDGKPTDTLEERVESILTASLEAHIRGIFDTAELLEWLDSSKIRRGVTFRPAFDLNFFIDDGGLPRLVGDERWRRRVEPSRAAADLAAHIQHGTTTYVGITAGEPVWTGRAASEILADLSTVLPAFYDNPRMHVRDLPIEPLHTASGLLFGHPSGIGVDSAAQHALLTHATGVRSATWAFAPGPDGMLVQAEVETSDAVNAATLMHAYTKSQPWFSGTVVPDTIEIAQSSAPGVE
jgi:hypothetical protein